MKLLIIDNADPTIAADQAFNDALIKSVAKYAHAEILNYTKLPPHSEIVENYAGVILSGVPLHYSFESVSDRHEYLNWITHTTIPVLGICLGHQIIGKSYGARLIKDTEAETGNCSLFVKQKDAIFAHLPDEFETETLHRASITVPNEFKILASTNRCNNVIMKHKWRPIYGMQFHPELHKNGEQLIKNFVAIAFKQQPKTLSLSYYINAALRTRSQLQKASFSLLRSLR